MAFFKHKTNRRERPRIDRMDVDIYGFVIDSADISTGSNIATKGSILTLARLLGFNLQGLTLKFVQHPYFPQNRIDVVLSTRHVSLKQKAPKDTENIFSFEKCMRCHQ